MAVFRCAKTKDYTIMSNHHLKDRRLSLKAKGLLSMMLSLPKEWDYTGWKHPNHPCSWARYGYRTVTNMTGISRRCAIRRSWKSRYPLSIHLPPCWK